MEDELTTGVLEDGVCNFRDGHIEILDAIIGISGVGDSKIDGGVDVDRDIVLGDYVLYKLWATCLCRSNTFIFKLIIPSVSVQGFM